jgi:hypothetical protein
MLKETGMSANGGIGYKWEPNMDPGRLFVVTAVVSNPRILGSNLVNFNYFPKYKSSILG